MSDQSTPASSPRQAEQLAESIRVRLAAWLTARSAVPEQPWSADDLADWEVRPVEEFLLFAPPGAANHLFLMSEDAVYGFAPSMQSLEEALVAARGNDQA